MQAVFENIIEDMRKKIENLEKAAAGTVNGLLVVHKASYGIFNSSKASHSALQEY